MPVTVCGDIASRPLEAMCLVGLGYNHLSMPPASIGPVKMALRAVDIGRLRARLLPRLEPGRGNDDVRHLVARFADAHDVPV